MLIYADIFWGIADIPDIFSGMTDIPYIDICGGWGKHLMLGPSQCSRQNSDIGLNMLRCNHDNLMCRDKLTLNSSVLTIKVEKGRI